MCKLAGLFLCIIDALNAHFVNARKQIQILRANIWLRNKHGLSLTYQLSERSKKLKFKIMKNAIETKPAFLFQDKNEIIAERDRMEANWSDSMRPRMQALSMISVRKFGVTISNLK